MAAPKKSNGEQPEPAVPSDSAWRIAQLAAILAARYPVHRSQHDHRNSDEDWRSVRDGEDSGLDYFYFSLLRRAQFLLAHAEARAGEIHASRLFEAPRFYTVKEGS